MMFNYYGQNWYLMTGMMFLVMGGLFALAFYALHTFMGNKPSLPLEILQKRLAKGEITQAEFDLTRKALL